MKEIKLYLCKDSKTHLLDFGDSSAQCRCEGLELMVPNTVDAAEEKHIPVMETVGDLLRVKVGSVDHPMQPEHYIEWIFVQTKQGGMYQKLAPGRQPMADFPVKLRDVLHVFAFCNLHGLWKGFGPNEGAPEFHETVCSAEFKDCIDT